MKKWLYLFFAIGVLLMAWDSGKQDMAIAAPSDASLIPEEAIRLRIIANSDSPEDQWLKRKVRDVVTEAVQPWVNSLEDIDEARNVIEEHLPELQKLVNQTIEESGFSYSDNAKVELGKVPFPTKMYGQIVYPAGEYEALRITLGAGEGQNWWCVLFPPLCFVDISSGDAVPNTVESTEPSPMNEKNEQKEPQVRFFLADLFHKIVSYF